MELVTRGDITFCLVLGRSGAPSPSQSTIRDPIVVKWGDWSRREILRTTCGRERGGPRTRCVDQRHKRGRLLSKDGRHTSLHGNTLSTPRCFTHVGTVPALTVTNPVHPSRRRFFTLGRLLPSASLTARPSDRLSWSPWGPWGPRRPVLPPPRHWPPDAP